MKSNYNMDKDWTDLLDDIHVRIIPFDAISAESQIRAYAEIDIKNIILIRGIKIIETKKGGLFIGYPSIRKKDGQFMDLVIVRDKSFANALRKHILHHYHNWGSEKPADSI